MFTDPKYPIYTISWRWIQDGDHDPEYPDLYKYLPEGRVTNSTSTHKMFKEDQNLDDLKKWAQDTFIDWTEKNNKKYQDKEEDRKYLWKNIEGLTIEIKDPKYESWSCTWFCHETFDVGQTDNEALNSFEQYVRRYEHMQRDFEKWSKHPDYICLMGAEDRYRWCGYQDQDGGRTMAPCRCNGCKEAGMLRINH